MNLYDAFSILIVITALFAYINHKFVKLHSSIGIMLIAFVFSLLLTLLGKFVPDLLKDISGLIGKFNFSELLLGSMLSFMLFAGAIHIEMEELRKERLSVILFSTIGVILSTFIVGTSIYLLLPLFGVQIAFLHCLLFGVVISPTDPIAVLSIIQETNIPRSTELKISGESLFNDGVAVVIFVTIHHVAQDPQSVTFLNVSGLFLREALGGLALGLLVGYGGFLLMKSIDNYKVEILITLAIVMGGYMLASKLQVSGPLAMVAAGIFIGNRGKRLAMSETTRENISKFWELIDDILNAILFLLIGLELLVIEFIHNYILIGAITIVMVLLTRFISIWLPSQIVKLSGKINFRTILILTWGGLRGGISVALALSLKPEMDRDIWVSLTYFVVAFSIIVQGLSIKKFAKQISQ
ncbi:MAG TPA: sodium:proton antiporter [Bacteroidales bacterium]|nr:sodium:proton antiporter [Bacteroidales bacterium]